MTTPVASIYRGSGTNFWLQDNFSSLFTGVLLFLLLIVVIIIASFAGMCYARLGDITRNTAKMADDKK